jgi:hypothetical protein
MVVAVNVDPELFVSNTVMRRFGKSEIVSPISAKNHQVLTEHLVLASRTLSQR